MEELESRHLLSGTLPISLTVTPALGMAPQVNPSAIGLVPAQVRRAYGFDHISFNHGTVPGDGSGQTIAIVTAYDDPSVAQDLQTFDRQFGLSNPPSFIKKELPGPQAVNPDWALETALDVEWAHAMAPGASLLLVETPSSSLDDMLAGVDYARQQAGVSVVSMSWGATEFSTETYFDATLTTPAGHLGGGGLAGGVTFVAASGDYGASGGTLWPAASPNAISVGGTQLTVDASGNYLQEVGWSDSGGGISPYETAPSFQKAVTGLTRRTTPDVAFNASTASPFVVYTSVPWDGQSGWLSVAGTSAGAPQWAGLMAIVDQGRALAGQGSLSNAGAALYGLPASDFHDVVQGSNGYAAHPGYDLVTGRGSPYADRIASQLVPAPSPPPVPNLDLSFLTRTLATFFGKTIGQNSVAKASVVSAEAALRLPSGSPVLLASEPLRSPERERRVPSC